MNQKQSRIHEKALQKSQAYRHAEAELLDVIQEVDTEKVYLALNYSSLFTYCTQALGLAESATYNLITVARAAKKIPALKAQVQSGQISVSNARRIAPVLTQENQTEWLEKAEKYSMRQLEKAIARVQPHGARPNQIKYVNESTVRLEVNLPEEFALKLREIENFENKNLTELLKLWIHEHHRKHSPQEKARRVVIKKGKQVHSKPAQNPKGQRTTVPAAHLHELHLKTGSQCTATTPSGRRCPHKKYLQVHHIKPLSKGGTHHPDNLTLLCSGHHRAHHHFFEKVKNPSQPVSSKFPPSGTAP